MARALAPERSRPAPRRRGRRGPRSAASRSSPPARARAPTPATVPRTDAVGCAPPTSDTSTRPPLSVIRNCRSGCFALGLHDQLDGALEPRRRLEDPWRQAENGADVDVLTGAWRAPRPGVAPARERAEDGDQFARTLRQLIVDSWRNLAIALPREEPVGHHAVQPRAQLLRGDSGQDALKLDEPARPGGEITDDEQRPLVTHEIQGARVWRPLVVGVTFGRWNRWYERPPWCGLGCAENTWSDDGRLLVSTITADDKDVITSASSCRLSRCMAATGATALASGERHEIEDVRNG